MSYRCEECGSQVPAGEKLIRAVTEVRYKEYPQGGHGTEIVAEKAVCPACLETLREAGELARLDNAPQNLS
jgi:DNA-directed RNA polymerase subunit RPC12/RpoP